jgi:hypothetical protein
MNWFITFEAIANDRLIGVPPVAAKPLLCGSSDLLVDRAAATIQKDMALLDNLPS